MTPQQQKRVNDLIYTSAEDCRISIANETDMIVLNNVLRFCQDHYAGHKTRLLVVARRLNQLARKQ